MSGIEKLRQLTGKELAKFIACGETNRCTMCAHYNILTGDKYCSNRQPTNYGIDTTECREGIETWLNSELEKEYEILCFDL